MESSDEELQVREARPGMIPHLHEIPVFDWAPAIRRGSMPFFFFFFFFFFTMPIQEQGALGVRDDIRGRRNHHRRQRQGDQPNPGRGETRVQDQGLGGRPHTSLASASPGPTTSSSSAKQRTSRRSSKKRPFQRSTGGTVHCPTAHCPTARVQYSIEEAEDDAPATDPERYATVLGKLQYLASSTRPDLSYAVGRLAQFKAPTTTHEKALRHLLGYLQRKSDYRLRLGGTQLQHQLETGGVIITSYSDAGFSTTADGVAAGGQLLLRLGELMVLWNSKKQARAATSTCEAEINAAHDALLDTLAIRNLLQDIEVPVREAWLLCDNKSTVHLINNSWYATGTRHLGQKDLTIRSYAESGDVRLKHVPTEQMLADFFTKEQRSTQLRQSVKELGLDGERTFLYREGW